jgi:hypothetical protein
MALIKEKPKTVKKPIAKKPPVTTTKKDAEVTKAVVVPANDTAEIKKDKEPSVSKEPEPVKKLNVISKVAPVPPKLVRYDLYIKDTVVNFTGKPKRAIAVNGQIPMPTLTFTEGDTAEIYVHNLLKEETSLHWHGLFLPNQEDGVPNLTQMPIKHGSTHIYRFPIIQHGTH